MLETHRPPLQREAGGGVGVGGGPVKLGNGETSKMSGFFFFFSVSHIPKGKGREVWKLAGLCLTFPSL